MLAYNNLSKITDKQLEFLGKLMSYFKTSINDVDKEDIYNLGEEYNKIFAAFIGKHQDERMISEFTSVINLIHLDIKSFCEHCSMICVELM